MVESKKSTSSFEGIKEAINKHLPEVVGRIFCEETGVLPKITNVDYREILGGNAKTTIVNVVGEYSQNGSNYHSFEIYVKSYQGHNGKNTHAIDYIIRPKVPWEYEAGVHDLFRESKIVPQAFRFENIEDLQDKLITLPAGDQTLEQRAEEIASQNKGRDIAKIQLPLFLNVSSSLALFHHYAIEDVWINLVGEGTRVAREMSRKVRGKPLRKASNYLRSWLGYKKIDSIPQETLEQFCDLYSPIIGQLKNAEKKIIHGAADGKNIVSKKEGGWRGPDIKSEDNGNIIFIDLESVRADNHLVDLSSIATIPTSYLGPEQWGEMMEQYNETRLRLQGIEPEERKTFFSVPFSFMTFGSKKSPQGFRLYEDVWRGMRSLFYSGAIHNSFKIGAKIKDTEREFPEMFKRLIEEHPYMAESVTSMKRFMTLALESIVTNPQDFIAEDFLRSPNSFMKEEIEKLSGLLDFFRKKEICL